MLDIRLLRAKPELVQENLDRRGKGYSIEGVLSLDEERRVILGQVEEKKALRNKVSKSIGALIAKGENVEPVKEEMRLLGEAIASLDEDLKRVDEDLRMGLLSLPNLLLDEVPVGADEESNVLIKEEMVPRSFSFEPKDHHELGTDLGIIDFARGSKVAGSKFVFMRGLGARLERALINFMINSHLEEGYEEVVAPFVANSDSFYGTGQLPKFREDMFAIEDRDLFLIPTGEVPITNYFREDTLKEEELPIRFCGVTPCFRSEAGSAGKDTRGLIRLHQFNKVEMVWFTHPERSRGDLEAITAHGEAILKALKLPYRVVRLASGDTGFSSAMTYDIEVFLPSYNDYKEISSCSLYTDFQARRGKIRYKGVDGKPQFVHTLNGSGLAVGRTVAAILENYQEADGSIRIPEVLVPYMGTEVITKG